MSAPGEVAVAAALSMVGRPYVYGASSEDTTSFDCSSLVQWAWGRAGVSLPRASIDQLQALPPSPVADLRPGDLVFYDNALANGPPYRGVNHVVLWAGDGQVVEASSLAGGVRVVGLAAKGRPLGVRRPGVAGVVPEWKYEVDRAIALAGPNVVWRNGGMDHGIHGRVAAAAAMPDGRGHWVAAADGRVVAFGEAAHWGDGGFGVAAMAATPSGRGYWLAHADGQVSAFGDAEHCGDGGRPVMAMAAAPSGRGYWLLDAWGRVSAHGAARHWGDAVATVPVVGMAPTAWGEGYWTVDSAGRVSAFGDAVHGGNCLTDEVVVAMAASGDGYCALDVVGRVVAFEPAGARP